MTINIIDPHLHLFDLATGNYQWLKSDNPPFWPDKHLINQNFSCSDLTLNPAIHLAGFVHIEAGFDNEQPWREIKWLSDSVSPNIFSAVAFIDITASELTFNEQLTQLLNFDCVVGCRYILDDDALSILQQPQVIENLKTLAQHNFSFDVQMPLDDIHAVSELTKVLALIPTLHIIINHAGFPAEFSSETLAKIPSINPANAITGTAENNEAIDFKKIIAWQNWQQSITLLSRFDNCSIKCSGWEMTDRDYSMSWFNEVVSYCINAFTYKRVMLASNFPLCLFSNTSYADYWQMVIDSSVITQCSENEKSALLFNNALHIYKLKPL
ncbi:amidohydrolase family protein [Colwellia echini]|uniref:Amidohydrolase family protein n=1 Tax=Colwellia echini TaxID=1982103 RepID=A0ABY3MT97_9GAMM|nr:amidohydrolase family protein [Colwellia echini]TYK64425.1 amidohydrolase family protein [Colwellia echini]